MLEISGLTKTFPAGASGTAEVKAVDDLDLHVEPGQLFTLLGPSGCGKTTTLRCVAGLEFPDLGEISVGGRTLFSSARHVRVRASDRGLGMVFQSYAIWPHMDVFKNVAFPLNMVRRRKHLSRREISDRVHRVLDVVQLGDLAGRRATDLSGGQQQRLALARALVMEPPLLLLDEPLSNLDAKLREVMRFELKRLQREMGITAVYVTHDQSEALAMSNRIAVMRDGQVEQIGRPRDVYQSPASRFVADFIGISNFVTGTITEQRAHTHVIDSEIGSIEVTSEAPFSRGDQVIVSIRPESLDLKPVDGDDRAAGLGGCSIGRIETRAFMGEAIDYIVDLGVTKVRARLNPSATFSTGDRVEVHVLSEGAALLSGSD